MTERSPLHRPVKVDEIPPEGLEAVLEAKPAEREEIAALLGLVSLQSLHFRYRLERRGRGRVWLEGRLLAELTQTCVVSLEPLQAMIDEIVEAEFWPEAQIAGLGARGEEAAESHVLDWPEPISEGRLDLGPFLYETFATLIDPYPRKAGAVFEWKGDGPAKATTEAAPSPFAVLDSLKRR